MTRTPLARLDERFPRGWWMELPGKPAAVKTPWKVEAK